MAGDRQTMHDGDGAPSGVPAGEPLARGAASLLRSNRRPLIVAVFLWVFLVLLNRVLAGEIMAFDRAAIALMVDHVRTPWLTPVMKAVSFVVTPVPLVALIFAIGIGSRARGHRGLGVFCAGNLIGSTVLNQVLKFAIQRPRPDVTATGPRAASPRASRWPGARRACCARTAARSSSPCASGCSSSCSTACWRGRSWRSTGRPSRLWSITSGRRG